MQAAFLVLARLAAAAAAAQPAVTLTVQVVDPSGAGIPHAIVVLESAGRTVDVTADAAGLATTAVAPGTYEIVVSADGFDARSQTVRLAPGRARRIEVELPLSRVVETLTVLPESAGAAATAIGPDQIDALADDPDALEEFIRDVGGPEATVTVDGFEGGRLPPKDQVAQLVVTTDPYSAQFHEVGSSRVDVITKPGVGTWEGRASFTFGSDALSARNPFAPEKLPFRTAIGSVSASGPLRRLNTSVSLDADIRRRRETRPLVALTPAGLVRNEAESATDEESVEVRTAHAVGSGGVLRNRLEWERSDATGAGLGDIDLPERAFSTRERQISVRSNLTNQLSHGVRQDIRAWFEWRAERLRPAREAQAIDVLGAFRAGGAQVTGTVESRSFLGAAEWAFPAAGRHAFRTGALVEQQRYRSSNVRDYLGTFVFPGLEAYLAARPTTYTQRFGSVDVALTDTRTGVFLQDDIRITPAVSVGLGIRQEFQPSIADAVNVSPRASLAWTTTDRTVVRVGFGAFYAWHATSLIEEAQRLEGQQSYELVIRNPGFPDPFSGGSAIAPLPPTRLVTTPDLRLARVWRGSITLERRFGRALNVRSTIYRQVGRGEPRARNVNAPIDGARPDPESGNVLLLGSSGRSRRTSAETNFTINGLWNRRLFGHVNYTLGQWLNDADSALSLPADSLHPEREWGPARQDVRHRGFAGLTLRIPNAFSVGLTNRWQSASPYNITAGEDTNGDTISNDRPPGVPRNAGRGRAFWTTDVHVSWMRSVSGAAAQRRGGGGSAGDRRDPQIVFSISARNVFNRPQYGSFNGVITSPLFGRPVSASNPRRVDVGVSFRF